MTSETIYIILPLDLAIHKNSPTGSLALIQQTPVVTEFILGGEAQWLSLCETESLVQS